MVIKCKNVYKKFDKNEIISNCNLEIEAGEFVCIYGKSGSGKTTLLNMIGSLEDVSEGSIEFLKDGKVYNTIQHKKFIRKNLVNFIFQNFALIQMKTVKYNLLFSMQELKLSKTEKLKLINQELTRVGLVDKIDSYIYELSGGEQQKVAILRALLKPCEIILADEPTGSLDEDNRQMVVEFFKEINDEGKTIIVVSHDKIFKSHASRIIELK
ncbi:MAG: ATP-binding cassette domain-containing protein [Bacilli bacterium]